MNTYGPPEFVLVKDRDEVARVVQGGRNIGEIYCYAVMFESTGEVKNYSVKHLTPCDAQGQPLR